MNVGWKWVFWVAEGQCVCGCEGVLYQQKWSSFGLMLSVSQSGRALPPAPLCGGTKSPLACSRTAGADLPPWSIPALAQPQPLLRQEPKSRSHSGLVAFEWLFCGPSADAFPTPASGCFPRAGAGPAPHRGSQASEGKSHNQGRQHNRAWGASSQLLGFNTPGPPITFSFPSSFTYVNDDPQEVIVGERRELASLDLLNHFITGTRSEWPFSAGSASPSPSPFI